MRAQISDALRELQYAVERGEEFPDACARVALRWKVDHDILRVAYDDLCREEQQRAA